jgi:hypothetical protein
MALTLVPYTSPWTAAARAFNERLRAAQAAIDFALAHDATETQYLITDGEVVRGGCLAALESGRAGPAAAEIASVQSPLSEGLFDPRFAGVSPWLVREIARRWPYSYSVGMGALDRPYPRLLQALRWKLLPVPFYFRVLRGGPFLRSMPAVRSRPGARWAGWLPLLPTAAFRMLHASRSAGGARRPEGLETVAAFAPADTAAWESQAGQLTFSVSRAAAVLNQRYRSGMTLARFSGGFLVLKTTQFTADRYFGSLRVTTWADGFAEPGREGELVRGAEELARAAGADLLITNQLYAPIQTAIAGRGWLSHASNYLVAWSPALAALADPASSHVTRRDGDGLISL